MMAFFMAMVLCALSGLALDLAAGHFVGVSLAEHWWHSVIAGTVGGVIGLGLAQLDSGRQTRNLRI